MDGLDPTLTLKAFDILQHLRTEILFEIIWGMAKAEA